MPPARRSARARAPRAASLAALGLARSPPAGLAGATASKRDEAGPLCHPQFLSLEGCLGSDYDRLRVECNETYGELFRCLERDWRHLDDARGYPRPAQAFNRLRLCRHGLMLFNPLDWYIGRGLEVYGEWGERKVHMLETIVKEGHVVVEVGAHIGSLTLPLSRLVGPRGRVLAFEPFYPSFATLAANVGLNSLQNVEVRQAVVGDKFGRLFMNRHSLAFNVHEFFNFGSMNYNGLRVYNATDDVERPSVDWDEYAVTPLDQLSVTRLDFVKVDAESMELAVLRGAQRMVKKFKPVLFIEYRNPWEKNTNLLDVLRKKMRYECVLLRIPVFHMKNFRNHSEDIWGGRTKLVSFNLLCKHRWWEYPDMDDAVLELFDTAVDTDIEGLRTTPTADPFEAMALSSRQAQGSEAAGSLDLAGGELQGASLQEFLAQQPGSTRQQAGQDMTLDELLAEAPAARQAVPGRGGSTPHQTGEEREEMTLDELLGEVPAARQATPGRRGAARQQAGQEHEEMTLDELLGEAAPLPAARQATPGRGSLPQGAGSGGGIPRRQAAAAAGDEGLTLDELLGEERTSGRPGAGGASRLRSEDLTLDELLGDMPVEGAASQPVPGGRADFGRRSTAERGAVSGMTLDELLDGALQEEDGHADSSPNPGEAPGGPRGTRRAKPWEEMTLDDLLGPEPLRAEGEQPFLDELLGPTAGGQDELSLDDILAPEEPTPQAPQALLPAAPRSPPRPGPRASTAAEVPPAAGPKGAKATKVPGGGGAARGRGAAGGATGGGVERPRVKVPYEIEITLDEL